MVECVKSLEAELQLGSFRVQPEILRERKIPVVRSRQTHEVAPRWSKCAGRRKSKRCGVKVDRAVSFHLPIAHDQGPLIERSAETAQIPSDRWRERVPSL